MKRHVFNKDSKLCNWKLYGSRCLVVIKKHYVFYRYRTEGPFLRHILETANAVLC